MGDVDLIIFFNLCSCCPLNLQDEQRLLNFHYSNLEFACGASLDKVSIP